MAALWEKSKRTLTLHDLHSQSHLASFDLFRYDPFGSGIEKTIFSADLKITASLRAPAGTILEKFGLGKERATGNEVAFLDVKTGQIICTLKRAYFDEYWLSDSGHYAVTRKKRELRVFHIVEI